MNINISNLNVKVSESSDKIDKQITQNNTHMGYTQSLLDHNRNMEHSL